MKIVNEIPGQVCEGGGKKKKSKGNKIKKVVKSENKLYDKKLEGKDQKKNSSGDMKKNI